MWPLIVKALLSGGLIVLVSECAKRSTWLAAILASLPLTSILALCWLYYDTRDVGRIAVLTRQIFWLVLPSLTFFVALPMLLDKGVSFVRALLLACGLTALAYALMNALLHRAGIAA